MNNTYIESEKTESDLIVHSGNMWPWRVVANLLRLHHFECYADL